ncbi:MAG TPA: hypothetical protein VN841_15800 [Bryobacteraceae bacterium]|nr:hypothetical protein [Bryobacteraceae bacterium]
MQTRKLLLVLATAAFGITLVPGSASAASNKYNVSFDRPAVIGGVELKPGEYRLTIDGEKATLASKQQTAEADVAMHTEQRKFSSTTVRYELGDGKASVTQIRLGGTNQVLDFPGQAAAKSGGGGAVRNTAK